MPTCIHSVVWSRGVVWVRKVIVEKCGYIHVLTNSFKLHKESR